MQLTAHALVTIEDRDGRKLCSGVAVGDDRVLTATHCLPGADAIRGSDGRAVRFRLEARAKGADAALLEAPIRSSTLSCEPGRWLLRAGRAPCAIEDARCSPQPGDSGSPVIECESGRPRVVGVLSGLHHRGAETQMIVAAVRSLEPTGHFGLAILALPFVFALLWRRARTASSRKCCLR
jgi:hypothetical protein